ncbi:chorismate mutase [Clostridium sp.]|uniref:chorismate mutase n=1 Tax=Clostridium sp. TaxID=1506 RepID=UPI00263860C6|nr:chorismate mutase [Clostridium sp.]
MNNLEQYRKEIDLIDKELITLFERRMDVVKKVGNYKKENNLEILNSKREEEIIEKNINNLVNKDYKDIGREFFENIMKLSRELQENLIK